MRQTAKALSAMRARQVFMSHVAVEDVIAVADRVLQKAKSDHLDEDGSWARFFLSETIGKLGAAQLPIPALDGLDLSTMDGCIAATQNVVEAQADGRLTPEHAESYRRSIEQAMKGHRSKAGEALLDRLEDAGAVTVFAHATDTAEQVGARVTEMIEAREAKPTQGA